jgi:integrase
MRIDVRDTRLPENRLTISARTTDPIQYALRKAAIYALMDDGVRGREIIQRLKDRRLRIEHVAEKVHARRIEEIIPADEQLEDAPDPILLGETIDRFLRLVKAKKSAGTLEQYEGFCRGMERGFGVARDHRGKITKDVAVAGITTIQAEGWLHGPKPQRKKGAPDRPWSARRQNVAHSVAHQVWALAIAEDAERSEQTGAARTLNRNLWKHSTGHVAPPEVRRTRTVFLTRQQAGRLLRAVRGRPQGVLIALGLYAGLRAGEAKHLRMDIDVRLARGELAIQSRDGAFPWSTKGNNSVREVPINRPLARWIRRHIRDGYAGKVYLIHPSTGDRPISPKTHERWVVEAFRAARVEYGRDRGQGATFHTLRHTFASWLAQRDVQIKKIAQLMGDTVEMVDKVYSHLTPKDLHAAVERLGRKG